MNAQLGDPELLRTLSAIIVEALRIDPARITLNSKIFDDLGAESLDIIDIRFRIEREFGIKIAQDEIMNSLGDVLSASAIREKFTISSVVAYLKNRLQGA